MDERRMSPARSTQEARRRMVERLAGHIGHGGSLAGFAQESGAPLWRLMAMARRIGVDLLQLPAEQRRRVSGECLSCGSKEECEAWLASGSCEGYARFCPNAARLALIRPRE